MARQPDPIDETDRRNMIAWKRQGLSFDQLVYAFGGKYKRGKIVGEITRAQEPGELPPQGTVAVVGTPQVPTPDTAVRTFAPGAPGWVVIKPQQPNHVYYHTTEPTIVVTQPPVQQKESNPLEYMLRKAIDVGIERYMAPPQPPMQQPAVQVQPYGQYEIDALKQRMLLEDQRHQAEQRRQGDEQEKRQREEQEKRQREAREAEEKRRLDVEQKAEEEQRQAKLWEDYRKSTEEAKRRRDEGNKEIVKIFSKYQADEAKNVDDYISVTHANWMKQEESRKACEPVRDAAVQDEIQHYREAGKIVDKILETLTPKPRTFTEHPVFQTYQFVHNEARELMQIRTERERKDQNTMLLAGAGVFALFTGLAILGNRLNRNQQRRTN